MDFTSTLGIDQKVEFTPMQRHCLAYSIASEVLYGTITAVRFTKAKVFYDIIDDYFGILFDSVDSSKVFGLNFPKKSLEEPND